MTEESAFADLEPAQLHYLKSQYVLSEQLLEQTEQTLKQQLKDVERAQKQVRDLMRQLDHHLEPPKRARSAKTSQQQS